MIRAVAKATILFGFGRLPGGARLYRTLTREKMGTQATHVDKLARVWPGYVQVWRDECGVDLERKTLWMHDGGYTPFPFIMGYLLTGTGLIVTNEEGRILDQYAARSLEAGLNLDIPGVPFERMERIGRLREENASAARIKEELLGAELKSEPHAIPISNESVDICHSGGTLEHYRPDKLYQFAKECHRVLRPGGVASHVFDHRDHLYHADKRYPFLNHLRFRERDYRILFGHALTYHNRLLPAEVVELFEGLGFETIALRRRNLPAMDAFDREIPAGSLQGLPRGNLAKQFRHATDADLHTAACHYLFKKKGR